MDIARFRAFATSVETGSFTRAAEKLNYTPSGVCQLVNALEKELGFPVLLRDKRGVRPTTEGNRILPVVRELLHQDDLLQQLSAEINGLTMGKITIGSYSSIATHWLPRIIKEFQDMYPQIEIHLMEGIRQEIDEWLVDRSIDLALFSYKPGMNYDWIPLKEDQMLAVLPRNHPLAQADAYPLSNCQNEKFIMPGMGRDEDVAELFRRNHLSPQISFSTLENFATLSMIEQGMGISIMNDLITRNWICDVAKLPLDPPQSVTFGIAVPSMNNTSPIVRRFIDFSVEQLRSE